MSVNLWMEWDTKMLLVFSNPTFNACVREDTLLYPHTPDEIMSTIIRKELTILVCVRKRLTVDA